MNTTVSSEKTKSTNVSLFPPPPWQLINKLFPSTSVSNASPRPPTPPNSSAYRMFGNFYNADDAILRSLESQDVRRVYPQTYNRKRELRKINFSILANYLDLLDIITRDPSSPKRGEKLDHLAILFINMHHLVNEYRQHQAQDLFREILRYQVNIASETVDKAELYLSRADELLRTSGQDLILPGMSSYSNINFNNDVDNVRNGLCELGPELSPFLQAIFDETLVYSVPKDDGEFPKTVCFPSINVTEGQSFGELNASNTSDFDHLSTISKHLDTALWQFLLDDGNNDATNDSKPLLLESQDLEMNSN